MTGSAGNRRASTVKMSVLVSGHRTSISLEAEFEREFRRICRKLGEPLGTAVTRIDRQRKPDQSLSSAIRVFVLGHVRDEVRMRSP